MQSQLGKSLRAQTTAPPRPTIRSSARQPTEQPRKFLSNPSIPPPKHHQQKSARSRSESVLLSLARLEAQSVCVHIRGIDPRMNDKGLQRKSAPTAATSALPC